MNKIFLIQLLLFSFATQAQVTTIANRVVVRDSFSLAGYWISSIHGMNEVDNSSQSLIYDLALKPYVGRLATAPGIIQTSRTDSMLTLHPVTRQLALTPVILVPTDSLLDAVFIHPQYLSIFFTESIRLEDTLHLTVKSSDSITTTLAVIDNGQFAIAYGLPPFSLYLHYQNNMDSELVKLSIAFSEGYNPLMRSNNEGYWWLRHGVSKEVYLEGLAGHYILSLNWEYQRPQSDYTDHHFLLNNNMTNMVMEVNEELVQPGKHTDLHKTVLRSPNLDIYARKLHYTRTGIPVIVNQAANPVIADIYKNGVLFNTVTFTGAYHMTRDTSWHSTRVDIRNKP